MQNIELYRTRLSIHNVCCLSKISVDKFNSFHAADETEGFDITFSYPYYHLHARLSKRSVTPYLDLPR